MSPPVDSSRARREIAAWRRALTVAAALLVATAVTAVWHFIAFRVHGVTGSGASGAALAHLRLHGLRLMTDAWVLTLFAVGAVGMRMLPLNAGTQTLAALWKQARVVDGQQLSVEGIAGPVSVLGALSMLPPGAPVMVQLDAGGGVGFRAGAVPVRAWRPGTTRELYRPAVRMLRRRGALAWTMVALAALALATQ